MPSTDEDTLIVTHDPVWGRRLSEAQALFSTERAGRRYLFCSDRCRTLFAVSASTLASRAATSETGEAPRQ